MINLLHAAASGPTPALIFDLDRLSAQYHALHQHLPEAKILYAVKANPSPKILERLAQLGCGFDLASPGEVALCLALGVPAERLSFGNSVKKQADIASAFAAGIRQFAFDSPQELDKLAAAAPGARVFCRIGVAGTGAQWPLTHKFGCSVEAAVALLVRAAQLGLQPAGVSFHVGSQQTLPAAWTHAIGHAHQVFVQLARLGIELEFINLGGGLPAHYHEPTPPLLAYIDAIREVLARTFGAQQPALFVEPGRFLVGDAGVLVAEVVLVADRPHERVPRWVYLDAGTYSGLDETVGERIHYRIEVLDPLGKHRDRPLGPVVLAGPTCDSTDVIYRHGIELPLDLQPGERIVFLSAGAYTTTCSSIDFNGFAPLGTRFVGASS